MPHPALNRQSFLIAWPVWLLLLAGFLLAPQLFGQGFGLSLLSQMLSLMVLALSYNLLLAQTGLLSFGHAAYAGFGAYGAVHGLNAIAAGRLNLPVFLLPLLAGFFAALLGVVLGYFSTKKSGTGFAMISLGVAELLAVASYLQIGQGFFGGESGVTANRALGAGWFAGPLAVYYLLAAWCLLCTVLIYGLTKTPLGAMANAVRDDPHRAAMLGYAPQRIRWLMFVIASFFAGVAGGLSALNFEMASPENFALSRSAAVLLAVFIGGVNCFFGPLIGSLVYVLFVVGLAAVSKAWLLYLGLLFILVVLYAPTGLAGLIIWHWQAWRSPARCLRTYFVGLFYAALFALGLVMMVEMGYCLPDEMTPDAICRLWLLPLNSAGWFSWCVALVCCVGGAVAGLRHAGWPRAWRVRLK